MKMFLLRRLSRRATILGMGLGIVFFVGCKKNSDASSGGYGNVPRKSVPSQFVGQFNYVTSIGAYTDPAGNYIPGYDHGIAITMNPDGTGSTIDQQDAGSYSGAVTTVVVSEKNTFEVTVVDQSTVHIVIHVVSGNDYQNGVLLHPLGSSLLYPNNDFDWTCSYGSDNQGRFYFEIPGASPMRFIKN